MKLAENIISIIAFYNALNAIDKACGVPVAQDNQEGILMYEGNCEYSRQNREILGSTKVGNGYNVLRGDDQGSAYPLLNTFSFDQKVAMKLSYLVPGESSRRSECFNIPDAFVTNNEAMGIDPTVSGWDSTFKNTAVACILCKIFT